MQYASHILLVRPAASAYNLETAHSNAFQRQLDLDVKVAVRRARQEFDEFANGLKREGVDVIVVDDTSSPAKPDAVFPNNWVTFHEDGTVILYPMCAPSRRLERRGDVVEALRKDFRVTEVLDLSRFEEEGRFLEGTGSMVFDHLSKIAYASLSQRTDKNLFLTVCERLKYQPVYFHALDRSGKAIYHTNVMMCLGEGFSIICLDSIADAAERQAVEESLEHSGHKVIPITLEQVGHFAGNMLAVRNAPGEVLLVCSRQAADSLTPEQKSQISVYARLVPLAIPTIESLGGGSARCMMAEVFLQPN